MLKTSPSCHLGLLVLGLSAFACGDSGGGGGTETDTDDTDSMTSPTVATTMVTGDPTTATETTTSATTIEPTTDPDTSDTDPSTETDTDPGSSSTGSFDCEAIPEGPFDAQEVFMPFDGSEDIAFDGNGNLAGKLQPAGATGEVVLVDAGGTATPLTDGIFAAYGLRYGEGGDLFVAEFTQGRVVRITPAGVVTTFSNSPLPNVNGLYPDFQDRVWFADFDVVGIIESDGNVVDVLTGGDAGGANGVVFDEDRSMVFYTNYNAGALRRAEIDNTGAASNPTILGMITNVLADGLSMDACGNVYMVDQAGGGTGMIYRWNLDEAGDLIGEPEALLNERTPDNIANAQFGRGAGFDEMTLYAAGTPGTVYSVDIGVPGAAVPM